MRRFLLVSSVALTVGACLGGATAFAGENWVGSWKLNTAKSKLSANGMRTQSLKFESTADGIVLNSEGTDAQGKPLHSTYTSKFDGKDVPWTGNPMADTASPNRIDDNTYKNVWKKDGKPTVTSTVMVSKDGKTLTIIQNGKDAQGASLNSLAVYDRQ
ncbi:MAG TPA: hypothetical protein VEQ10_14365 [Vicinamibacteria bacterium]|nr:hypothetical protein [Vicinamibacteria bacterium]